MDKQRQELNKLKVAELRQLAQGMPAIKSSKKAQLVEYIISSTMTDALPAEAETPIGTHRQHDEGKRIKIAPIFLKSKSAASFTACELCEGQRTVWSEIGIAVCPICSASDMSCSLPSPSVKQEPGVTRLRYQMDSEGKILIELGSVDPQKLVTLVTVYGFGLCESMEALQEHNSVEEATEFLMDRNRSSAENASIAEAQLNSEHTREETRVNKTTSQKEARNAVGDDLTVLLDIDNAFCSTYLFGDDLPGTGQVLKWVLEAESNRLVLFDYLVLRRDSIKWYKEHARSYFTGMEENELASIQSPTDISAWFMGKVDLVRKALFDIPAIGGCIPALFRKESVDDNSFQDDEIQLLSPKDLGNDSPRNVVLIE